jgi:membrane-associated protease RseP (regulator of RpoE activity)
LSSPETLWRGIPFAGALLFILTTHELGHYLLSKIHRVPVSLPLFIPGPPHFIGTFGAIIRMRGPILSRRALFDIGVAGPLAGFVVAVVALIVGLNLSTVVDRTGTFGLQLGEPLLLQFMAWVIIGPLPPEADVVLHPIGFAAWFGLFVTSLNLLPIGQLDGGHVAYALWGRRQRTLAMVFLPILLVLGFIGWPGWFLWAFMAGLWGLGHPPVIDPHVPLGRNRTIVGWIAFVVFIVTFAPVPFSFH